MYRIGQFRKSQFNGNFLEQLTQNLTIDYIDNKHTVFENTHFNVPFQDVCGQLESGEETVLNNENSYYLNFKVKQNPKYAQTFYLKLKKLNDNQTDNVEQILEEYIVPIGPNKTSEDESTEDEPTENLVLDKYSYYEIVFTPNQQGYDGIIWELERTLYDFQADIEGKIEGRKMEVEVICFAKIVDIMNTLRSSYAGMTNKTNLKKIGIQGPPSMLMCINGEQIRNSKSGIYEINNDKIEISSIGFVPKKDTYSDNGNDYFIMDFEY